MNKFAKFADGLTEIIPQHYVRYNYDMKKLFLALLLVPFAAFSAISDWDYTPFISYAVGKSPSAVIKQGRNFELLNLLWNKPQSLSTLKNSGFDLSDVDTVSLIQQGMIYCKDGIYHSAIPFIDSIATNNLRENALSIAKCIIDETEPDIKTFLSTLDSEGYKTSAFPLVHSLVFDDIIWQHIGVSQENTTICPTDSMTWEGVYYFFRPEKSDDTYGTNGIKLNEDQIFNFSWGSNSNAYLCNAFINTDVLKGIKCILKGEDLSDEMIRDCQTYGIIDKDRNLSIPVLDGKEIISTAADTLAKSAAASFTKHFDGKKIADVIGWTCNYNEAACKVILYHEVLSAIDKTLNETGILPIPDVLTSKSPADKKQTASVSYITRL